MEHSIISQTIDKQREFFATHQTKKVGFRIEMLKSLKKVILLNERKITEALYNDFRKSPFEAFSTEIMFVLRDIDYQIKHLKKWNKPQPVKAGILNFPAKGYVLSEPMGIALIIAPWNYPFQLLISPLVGAIAAGNCAVLKPARYTSHTSEIIKEIIEHVFEPKYVSIFLGGKETIEALLREKFDFIFFTGSPTLGKVVMTEAAKNLTPVCLELGGKSPCIIDETANLKIAAHRIAWGKFINAGQTCVAPDYLIINNSIKNDFLLELRNSIKNLYGENPIDSPDYARIINDSHFDMVSGYLKDGRIFSGGNTDKTQRYIEPTVLVDVNTDSQVMQEEIFGPVLPVLTYENIEEAIRFINSRPKPLALYLFSTSRKKQKEVFFKTSSGGACINDVVMHLTSHYMPFGGVGNSGMGRYHGKASFDLFSNKRSVLVKSDWLDIQFRYAPYGNKLKLIKRILLFLD